MGIIGLWSKKMSAPPFPPTALPGPKRQAVQLASYSNLVCPHAAPAPASHRRIVATCFITFRQPAAAGPGNNAGQCSCSHIVIWSARRGNEPGKSQKNSRDLLYYLPETSGRGTREQCRAVQLGPYPNLVCPAREFRVPARHLPRQVTEK